MKHGGKRAGSGRPKGYKKPIEQLSERTEIYSARVTPAEKTSLKEHLEKIRLTGGG